MEKGQFDQMESFMRRCLGDSAHDAEHIYRVLYNALAIAKTESHVDYDILITACLLHDIGRPEQAADPSLCHAAVGAEKAAAFLQDLGMEPDFTEAVCHCIRAHRFSKRQPPQTLEAKILFDADKLDVTGALGIARTLQYQGKHDTPLYRLKDGQVAVDADSDNRSFFQEYTRKLEKLYDVFFTEEGRRLATGKQHSAESFRNALYREILDGYEEGQAMLQKLLKS